MNETEFMAQLASWRNLGPLREIEDLRREMAAVADSMSDLDADVVAATLVALAREDDSSSLDALCDFLEFFARLHPRAGDGAAQPPRAQWTAGACRTDRRHRSS